MDDSGLDVVMRIRHQVFERELGIKLAFSGASDNGHATYLLARAGLDEEPVGCLCVLDTSGDSELHARFGLKFGPRARVARCTHLAVLKPYRGMNVPLALMVKAHHGVIVPRQFDYTWLLFDAERAGDSFLSRRPCFKPLPETFVSEYGCRRPLVRDERSPYARQDSIAGHEWAKYVQALAAFYDLEALRHFGNEVDSHLVIPEFLKRSRSFDLVERALEIAEGHIRLMRTKPVTTKAQRSAEGRESGNSVKPECGKFLVKIEKSPKAAII